MTVVAGLLTTGFAVPVARAAAPQPTCGQTITQSVTLTADLDCQSAPALKIGAAGIVLDLGGHDVYGGVSGNVKPWMIGDRGHDSVTVEDGSVSSPAAVPISVQGASDVHLIGLSTSAPVGGLHLAGGSHNVIQGSSFGYFDGAVVSDTNDLLVTDSSFVEENGNGLTLTGVDNATLDGDTFDAPGFDAHALVLDGSDNVIDDDSFVGPAEVVGGSSNALLSGQYLRAPQGESIVVDAAAKRTLVSSNTVVDDRGGGLILVAGPDSRITDNSVDAPGTLEGIVVSGPDAHIIGNTSNDDVENGIEVSGADARIKDNTTDGNGQNGILVTDPSAHISDNIADDNTLYGISATPGDIGGGNLATGNNVVNGAPGQQCLNISCTSGSGA
jgi:hypothetical protein